MSIEHHGSHTTDDRTRRFSPPPTGDTCSTTLARIGVALGAQRIELFVAAGDHAVRLGAWWAVAPLDTPPHPTSAGDRPLSWFPWGLGIIRPDSYLFVENAGTLPSHPAASTTLAERGVGSALHVPIVDGSAMLGAVCAFWHDERVCWPTGRHGQVLELGRSALGLVG